MLDERITTVLFDLDGSLLPMETERFTKAYFKLLAQKAAPYGYAPESLVAAVWKGTKAMVMNDGSMKNDQRFWEVFAGELGERVLDMRPIFDSFYANEFHGAKVATGENPLAKKAVEGLKIQGRQVVLATNPLFPAVGVATRLSWIGLEPEDFLHVTTYENSSYCKPNPAYFAQVLEAVGKRPEECLMVGNDPREDVLAAGQAGISAYLVTDCLENAGDADLSKMEKGSFREFLRFAGVD